MIKVFILLAIFIVVFYIYSSKKIKKRKEKTKNMDSVQEFHNAYQHLSGRQKERQLPKTSGEYQKYVTKYNSSEDYREKL